MHEINKPRRATYWVARSSDNSVVHTGITEPYQVTSSGLDVLDVAADENEHLGNLDAVAPKFPPLPSKGELVAGQIYSHRGKAVMVRQSHERTEHDPSEVPALFLMHRVNNWEVKSEPKEEQSTNVSKPM